MRRLTLNAIVAATCSAVAAFSCVASAGECPGDLDVSGHVDGGDLAILLGAWGACDDPGDCPADLDVSGDVDGADLAILLGEWGECPGPFDACGPGAGDCYSVNGTPGCDQVECCEKVCAEDPFCCDVAWDGLCVDGATALCSVCDGLCIDCGHPEAGDCCRPNGTPACSDIACCDTVCPVDPFCCEVDWDVDCANLAIELCDSICGSTGVCGQPDAGDCCDLNGNGTPACDDVECCEAVCSCDPFCCDIEWDSICAGEGIDGCGAMFLCKEICGGDPNFPCWPGAGDCCTANGSIGCQDEECCQSVCADDPFCCDVKWDQICADIANDICSVCQ